MIKKNHEQFNCLTKWAGIKSTEPLLELSCFLMFRTPYAFLLSLIFKNHISKSPSSLQIDFYKNHTIVCYGNTIGAQYESHYVCDLMMRTS